ncbi:MAG: SLC13 family permease [Pseudomonadota bacterium]
MKKALILPPVFSFLTFLVSANMGLSFEQSFTLSITLLCAIWWMLEPIPLAITSLLPIALFPLVGILTKQEVAQSYGSPLIILLLGGFILSTAMAKSGAHRRLAIHMVNAFGTQKGSHVVMGFMVAAATLSMWISNTATTLMLLPIAIAVLNSTEQRTLDKPLLLGIGYAASVGGIGTPIGTPPNLIFQQAYADTTGTEVGFLTWMTWAVPIVIIFVPLMAFWLSRHCRHAVTIALPEIDAWTSVEKRVLTVFALTAMIWITRQQPFGGWSGMLGLTGANDASIALLAVVAMFLVPAGKPNGEALLDWDTAKNIPWHVLLLFAGGITIATAFQRSGLSVIIGDNLSPLTQIPLLIAIFLIALCVTFLTEVTSNTATTTLLMPILASAALSANMDPALLMVPAAISASCAFMLPAATAPNAVIYSSNYLTVKDMVKQGFILNLLGTTVISLVLYWRLS